MKWNRIAEGHYEHGALMMWRLPDVNPPAWNVEDTATGEALVDGAATMRDAKALTAKALAMNTYQGGTMPNYIVIESTPGYMPEDDDPFITDDYSAAVAYMNERAAEYADDADGNYRVEYGIASANNYAAVMVWDDDKTHDLGRYIAVELCEDDA